MSPASAIAARPEKLSCALAPIWALWLALAPGICLAAQPASPAGIRVISGTVLGAKTGQPLAEADVELVNALDHHRLAGAQTDAEGRFQFTGLSDGRYDLRASRRGYITAAYQEHQEVSTAIVTGEGLDTTGIELTLEPQGVIFGVAEDSSGDPVPQARLTLYRQDRRSETQKMVRVMDATADAMGNYEFRRLAPASYYVCAAGMPWFATRRRDGRPPGTNRPRSPMDMAYPVTCYPGVTDANSAEPVSVAEGDRIPVNLSLAAVPSVQVSIELPPGDRSNGISIPQLRQEIFGDQEPAQSGGSWVSFQKENDPSGPASVVFSGLAPGQYEIELTSPGGGAMHFATLDATSDHASLDSTQAVAEAAISGKIEMDGGAALPSTLVLTLTPQQGGDGVNAPVDSSGSFSVQSLRPGVYETELVTGGLYALEITRLKAAGAGVTGHSLKIGSDPVTLAVSASEPRASVKGLVHVDGKPASGVFLVLVPADPAAGRDAWRQNQSDSDGTFIFPHVFPGSYTLVAIREGWTLDWARRGVIGRYLAKGVKVDVAAGAKAVELKEPLEAQPK
jgi:5-hydroxyisourate hydrolase-like protein (transthyretin family)